MGEAKLVTAEEAKALSENVRTFDDISAMDFFRLARTVVAVSEERARLLDILACERGERAPEGWEWCPPVPSAATERLWMSPGLTLGFVVHHDGKWHWSPAPKVESVPFDYALDAIEHAMKQGDDKAGEVRGG